MAASGDKPIMVKVDAIRENAWNPNAMDEATLKATIANVKRFGFNQPILVRAVNDPTVDPTIKYEVVDGAHRFRAARACGLTEIPVVVREFTDAEAKAQTIAMNTLRGEMDPERVAQLVREIDEEGIDGIETLDSFIGFTPEELDELDKHLAAADTPKPKPPAADQSNDVHDGYFLVVTCKGETDQLALLAKLEKDGYEVKVVVS